MVTKDTLRLLGLQSIMLLTIMCSSNAMEVCKNEKHKQKRQSWPKGWQSTQELSEHVQYLSAALVQMQQLMQKQDEEHKAEIREMKQYSNETRKLFLIREKSHGNGLIKTVKQAPSEDKIQQILKLVKHNGDFLEGHIEEFGQRIEDIEKNLATVINQNSQKSAEVIKALSELRNSEKHTPCKEFENLRQMLNTQEEGIYDAYSIGTPTASLKAPLCNTQAKNAPEDYSESLVILQHLLSIPVKPNGVTENKA